MGQRRLCVALLILFAFAGAGLAARRVSRQWVKRTISAHGFEWQDLSRRRRDPGNYQGVCGPPDVKYPFVGAGGEIVVDMGLGDEIVDRPGADFKVYEVGTAEDYWVLAAQSLSGPWRFVGYGNSVTAFDLNGSSLDWARYLVLADNECIVQGTPTEGSDFDAVENLHLAGSRESLEPQSIAGNNCLIGKWRYDGRFNSKPRSLENLLDGYDKVIGSPVPNRFDYVDSDNEEKFFSSAVLFMVGHRDFALDTGQQEALREYVDRGGFVLGDACCGNAYFAKAFYREFKQVFSDEEFIRLPADHEIYRSFYSLDANRLPLYGLIRGGRAVIVFSPNGLVCSWEQVECPGKHPMLPEAEAMQLGVNLIVYALTR